MTIANAMVAIQKHTEYTKNILRVFFGLNADKIYMIDPK